MLTVQLAQELLDTRIVVNSVSPGYVKTDLTGFTGFMTPEEGAKLPVEYALLGENAVSGRFVEAAGETPGKPALALPRTWRVARATRQGIRSPTFLAPYGQA